ncbi:MAG: ABC-type transport auxiliary lipoprotein family protein [Steroidobacterales bacterium]
MKIAPSAPSLMQRRAARLPWVLLLLAGCSGGLKSNLPPAQVYVLQPTIAAPAAPARSSGTVQVMLPLAAPGLAGDGIVVLHPGQRLDYYSAARWAAAAPIVLQTLAIEALRASNRFAMVESDAGPFAAEYVLSLELRHFEAEYRDSGPPTVHVSLIATLGRRGTRDAVVSFTADSEVRAEADRMQAVVAAFERATADALSQLAANAALPAAAQP